MAAPVFGFLAFTSGSFEGAIIRDMRLANALHQRGYKVVVYWRMDRNVELVNSGITQRMLCRATRYQFQKPCGVMDKLTAPLFSLPADMRRHFMQHRPDYLDRLMTNFCRCICDGGQSDPGLAKRLAKFIRKDGVTHLLPTFAMICPFAQAAKALNYSPFDYLVTFQGEEIFANYAQRIGRLADYHQRLRETVAASPWTAVAVRRDYIDRLAEGKGIPTTRPTRIYPRIEMPPGQGKPRFSGLFQRFPHAAR